MFNEKSSVDVLEEVVVEDVALSEELVEEEVSARRRRASGIASFEDSMESFVEGLEYVGSACVV